MSMQGRSSMKGESIRGRWSNTGYESYCYVEHWRRVKRPDNNLMKLRSERFSVNGKGACEARYSQSAMAPMAEVT